MPPSCPINPEADLSSALLGRLNLHSIGSKKLVCQDQRGGLNDLATAGRHGVRDEKRFFRSPLRVDNKDSFIKAYHDFRNSVDLTKSGVLPDLENLVWYILMGVPPVPADRESAEDAPAQAIDQRVSILKAVFVEANGNQDDEFIDEGLRRYDEAGKTAKALLKENSRNTVIQE
jgi:hypothetical protein